MTSDESCFFCATSHLLVLYQLAPIKIRVSRKYIYHLERIDGTISHVLVFHGPLLYKSPPNLGVAGDGVTDLVFRVCRG